MIRMQCSCGKIFNIPDEHRGRRGRCPDCSTIIVVPNETDYIPTFEQEPPARQAFSAQDLFEYVVDAVIGISDGGQLYGSGVFVDDRGMIVTNRHVVGTASKVKVQLNNGEEYVGELMCSYKDVDLAFLQIPCESEIYASLFDSPQLRVGETLFAIGHPLGLQNTITRGIVSALKREVDGADHIQTDAPINPGNSGGPLFNEYAEIVGINKMGLRETHGLGFAIPVDVVRERYERLKNTPGIFSKAYCGICGKNSRKMRYCEHCGIELDAQWPMMSINPKRRQQVQLGGLSLQECHVCKTMAHADDKYCPFCGTMLSQRAG